jgi:hypothetical protein
MKGRLPGTKGQIAMVTKKCTIWARIPLPTESYFFDPLKVENVEGRSTLCVHSQGLDQA